MNPLDFFGQHERNGDHNIEFALDSSTSGKLRALQGKEKIGFREYIGNDYLNRAKRAWRRSNPIAANQADIVYWVIYDQYFLAPGQNMPSKFTFFQVPQGQTITSGVTTYTKAKQNTNMTQVSTLEAPQWMNTIGLGIYFGSNMVKPDIDNVLNTYYLEYWVTAKIYAEGPLQVFPAGAGLSGGTTVAEAQSWSNGWPVNTNVFDLRLPAGIHLGTGTDDTGATVPITTDGLMGITILQSQTFRVDVKADSPAGTPFFALPVALTTGAATPPGTGFNGSCYLYGILSRGVQ